MYFAHSAKRPAVRALIWALALVAIVPVSATAMDLMLGWTRSDVGLDGQGEGISLSAAHYMPMGTDGSFDLGLELAYVQRAGSQPGYFSSETLGFYLDEGKVRLHVLQPGLNLGYSKTLGSWIWRIYAGGAVGLKLDESWELPEGDWQDPYGYDDLDFLGIVGLTVIVGPMLLDLRYCAGLTEQLILRNELDTFTAKADVDPLPGVMDPEDGSKLSNFQLGVGFRF